jgi:hypothetical protein
VPFLRAIYRTLGPGLALPPFETLFGGGPWGVATNLGEGTATAWNPLAMGTVLLACLVVSCLLYRAGGASVRQTALWYCGEKHRAEEVKFTAFSLYLPFKRFFTVRIGSYQQEGIYPAVRIPKVKLPTELRRAFDIDEYLYNPVVRWAMDFMDRFSRIHVGIPQVYVLWMVIGIVFAIAILFALSTV